MKWSIKERFTEWQKIPNNVLKIRSAIENKKEKQKKRATETTNKNHKINQKRFIQENIFISWPLD